MHTPSPDVAAVRDAIVSLRRAIHQHPELAWQETRTAARVAEFLDGSGLAVRTGLGGTGRAREHAAAPDARCCCAWTWTRCPSRRRRARPTPRSVPETMHACGHDGHVAMGAVARARPGRRAPLAGPVRVLFQPAEEGEGGAQAMVADGVLDGVDVVLGVHLWNELPVGTLGVKAGPLMAAVDRAADRGARARRPRRQAAPRGGPGGGGGPRGDRAADHRGARGRRPLQSAVVTIGSIHGGQAFNVIPDEVVLTGTIRTFDAALRRSMPERITRIARGVAEGLQCPAEVEVRAGNPPVVNDAAHGGDRARARPPRVVGEASVVVARAHHGRRGHGGLLRARARLLRVRRAPPTPRAASTSRTTARASTSTRTRSRSVRVPGGGGGGSAPRLTRVSASRPRGAGWPARRAPPRWRGRCPGPPARRSSRPSRP